MRMFHCPLRRPFSASRRLPGRAKSPKRVAASSSSSLRDALRAKPKEHPQVVRELGLDPDEPGLEKLDKAKAGLLIAEVLDGVKRPPPADRQ